MTIRQLHVQTHVLVLKTAQLVVTVVRRLSALATIMNQTQITLLVYKNSKSNITNA